MIGDYYKTHKDNVIDLFNGYKEKRGNYDDSVGMDYLEKRIDSLKNSKFTLAVAGEVKAGKSTFINALLGTELLPADVLQASNAIVEIFKSSKSFLRVKYANGKEEEIYDDLSTPDIDEARERLHEICRIRSEYREIPTTLIDGFIINSQTELEITASLIQELKDQSGEDLTGKETLLKQYIAERTKDKIPIEINFGYPLKWNFNELRIVDSPGVNALGGVQDLSFQFFNNADAILFAHPIKPVESESFRKFVDHVITNRSKKALFLVLTHAGLYPDPDIEKLHSEAVRLYKNDIFEERILVVDSLLKLIHGDLMGGKTVKEIRKTEGKKRILAYFKDKAEDEEKDLKDVVLEGSRFEKMFKVIDKFSMEAPNLQLREILESMKKGYEYRECQHTEERDLLTKKQKNPQEFEIAIDKLIHSLAEYKKLMYETVEDLTSDFTGKDSEWIKSIDILKDKYPRLIDSSSTLELVRKHLKDALDEMTDRENIFSRSLTNELKGKLEERGATFGGSHKITPPKVDLDAIEDQAKKKAYKTINTYKNREVDFWDVVGFGLPRLFRDNAVKTGEARGYDKRKHLNLFKEQCNNLFYKHIYDLRERSKKVLAMYLESFSKKMNVVIEKRQEALQDEKDKKETNDKIIGRIKDLDKKKDEIQPELMRLKEVLGNI